MLTQNEILTVMREGIFVALTSAMPMLLAGLVIGVLVSIFQATTQINEQTMAFVPKIIGILFTLLLFGGWIITRLTDYTRELYTMINIMLN